MILLHGLHSEDKIELKKFNGEKNTRFNDFCKGYTENDIFNSTLLFKPPLNIFICEPNFLFSLKVLTIGSTYFMFLFFRYFF